VGDQWKVLDTFVEQGRDFTQGKFGFLIQGNDEIAISDFKFLPPVTKHAALKRHPTSGVLINISHMRSHYVCVASLGRLL